MENLTIEETKYTPSINLNVERGTVDIIGKSYPENTFEFYEPVMKWLEDYFKGNAQKKTVLNFEIIYFFPTDFFTGRGKNKQNFYSDFYS